MTGRAGLILDRDGTLIDIVRDEETGTIATAFHPSQLRLLPGVVEGLKRARAAGYALGIATNQPAPAKGQASAAAIARTNMALLELLRERGAPIDALEACMHHPDGGPGGDASLVGPCACRKPMPGMLHTLIARLDLDRARTWMVGDTATDVSAGNAAGVRTALVFAAGRCDLCPLRGGPTVEPDAVAPTFDALVEEILRR
jgi:D-glycero-D-manno-heptose 1,7-bisphosphate phosphatase